MLQNDCGCDPWATFVELADKNGKRYTVLEFDTLLDSSSIDSKGWTDIAQTIFRNYTLYDGFVVLHGTDSLAYTCSALSFMLQSLGKPVILTGRYNQIQTVTTLIDKAITRIPSALFRAKE